MKYSENIDFLSGYDSKILDVRDSPFDLGITCGNITQKSLSDDYSGIFIIDDAHKYSEYLKLASLFSFQGWGVQAQTSFVPDNKDPYSNSEVRFVAYRKQQYLYKEYSIPPPFNKDAIQILQSLGKEGFRKIYGDYYVMGTVFGRSMEIAVTIKAHSFDEKQQISDKLSTSFKDLMTKGSGSTNFLNNVASQFNNSQAEIKVIYNGQDTGTGISSINLDTVSNSIINLNSTGASGTGIYLVLQKYSTHPDYKKFMNDSNRPLQINESLQNLLYDATIRIKVLYQWYLIQDIGMKQILDNTNFLQNVTNAENLLMKCEEKFSNTGVLNNSVITLVNQLEAQYYHLNTFMQASQYEQLQNEILQLKNNNFTAQYQELLNKIRNLQKNTFRRCRLCFQETEGSDQCQGSRYSCSQPAEYKLDGTYSPAFWNDVFRDDTDGRGGGCKYQWVVQCDNGSGGF